MKNAEAEKGANDRTIKETKLQKVRMARGLSQRQLAAVSGVSKRAIECYEQRVRDIEGARVEALCDLCIALQCKITNILETEPLIEKFNMTK